MNAINERLADLESKGTPVTIGLIGAGQMGQEILCQVQLMTDLGFLTRGAASARKLNCREMDVPAPAGQAIDRA
jgi:predicted homoserine dehydrogenase-like protein